MVKELSFYLLLIFISNISLFAGELSNLDALPPSYNWVEYSFPVYNDSVPCDRASNSSVSIDAIFLAQLHAQEVDWPFFYVIANRPLLAEVILSGAGAAPNVRLSAYHNDALVAERCLTGPIDVPQNIDPLIHTKSNRYTVTLPKEWISEGLSIRIEAGVTDTMITKEELDVGPAPELNLVQIAMDLLDYNNGKEDPEIPQSFLGDFASAYPASVTRIGQFPARMIFDRIVFTKSDASVVLACRDDLEDRTNCGDYSDVSGMDQLAAILRFVHAMQYATGDYGYSYYYGNILNFYTGGWGGNKAFAGGGYEGIFLHEMGHALSLPHWGDWYNRADPTDYEYSYPYGGMTGGGGGRGQSWNYYQNIDEYISPICMDESSDKYGNERSDGMQRSYACDEMRSDGLGPWDGFGDFSAYGMFRFMVGAEETQTGTVPYFGENPTYQLSKQKGYPLLVKNSAGERELKRHSAQPQNLIDAEKYDFLRPEQWNVPVYTIYGSYHPEDTHANVLYEPLSYAGNLPALIDPTDPTMFNTLKEQQTYGSYFWWSRDLTFRFTYADGTERIALYPYSAVDRNWQRASHPWRWDLLYYAITIPADANLVKVELLHRPFAVRYSSTNYEGNINYAPNTITPENFLDNATVISTWNGVVQPAEVIPEADYVISASGENSPRETALKAFDESDSTKWLTFQNSGWIQITYTGDTEKIIKEYSVTSANDVSGRDPRTWVLQGSNTGDNWVALDERSDECFENRLEQRSFVVSNTTAYKMYRLTISSINEPSSNILQIAEVTLRESVTNGIQPGVTGSCIEEYSSSSYSSSAESSENSEEVSSSVSIESSFDDIMSSVIQNSSSELSSDDATPIATGEYYFNNKEIIAVSTIGTVIKSIAVPQGAVRYTVYSVRGEVIAAKHIDEQQYIQVQSSTPIGLMFIRFE